MPDALFAQVQSTIRMYTTPFEFYSLVGGLDICLQVLNNWLEVADHTNFCGHWLRTQDGVGYRKAHSAREQYHSTMFAQFLFKIILFSTSGNA